MTSLLRTHTLAKDRREKGSGREERSLVVVAMEQTNCLPQGWVCQKFASSTWSLGALFASPPDPVLAFLANVYMRACQKTPLVIPVPFISNRIILVRDAHTWFEGECIILRMAEDYTNRKLLARSDIDSRRRMNKSTASLTLLSSKEQDLGRFHRGDVRQAASKSNGRMNFHGRLHGTHGSKYWRLDDL